MLLQWLQLQWLVAPILIISLTIYFGGRRSTRSILIICAAAIIAIAFRWMRNGAESLLYGQQGSDLIDSIASQATAVLFLAAWVLALVAAAKHRQGRWFVLLVAAAYLSYTSVTVSEFQGYPCPHGPIATPDYPACFTSASVVIVLVTLGHLIGPAATLAYGIVDPGWHQRQPPEGLAVSSLHDKRKPDEDALSAD